MSDPTLHILEDILYNVSHDRSNYLEPKLIVVGAGGRQEFVLKSPYFKVSPHQWEIVYDIAPYETITRRTVQKVRGYKPYWDVEVQAAGWSYYTQLTRFLTQNARHLDDDLRPTYKLYFAPPGDYHRPEIEVNVALGNTFGLDYFAGKYRGYTFKFRIIGAKLYDYPVLPVRLIIDPIPSDVDIVMGAAGCGFEDEIV